MNQDEQGGEFVLMMVVGLALALAALSSCTKQVPVKVVEKEIVRVEVPTPVLQRCRRPALPAELPTPMPYKCETGHLCFDAENKGKLDQFLGLMLWYVNWLETNCTEPSIQEMQEMVDEEVQKKDKGPML